MKPIQVYSVTHEEGLEQPIEALLQLLKSGDWVEMEGDLGAGKTTFVRRLLRHLGYSEPVPSPTYPLLLEYEIAEKKIIHIDGFRLDAKHSDPWDFREWKNEILFVEWSEKTNLPKDRFRFRVKLERKGETEREITLFSL